jgi:nucleoid-associated protein YgaU
VMPSAVAVSLSLKYTLFDGKGRPVRATASLTLREHRSASQQLAETRAQSPDKANVAKVRAGDTLPGIAFREYGDATLWRPIAAANRLPNPLALSPGQELVVPKVV